MASMDGKPKAAAAPAPRKPSVAKIAAPQPKSTSTSEPLPTNLPDASPAPPKTPAPATETKAASAPVAEPAATPNSLTEKAITLITREAQLDPTDVTDDAEFAGLGVDSLMSLVIAEKLRTELDIKVNGSLFLDYQTIGDLREWLDQYSG